MEIEEAIYLFDKNKELIHSISPDDIIESTQNPVLNGLITHTVRSVYTDAIEDAQFFGAVDVDDPNIFWLYKIDTKGSDNGVSALKGTYVLFDDLKGRGGVMIDRRPQNESVTRILPDILSGTGWQVGQVRTTNTGTSNYYYTSKLEAFWDFLDKWRVEFRPRMTYSKGKITGKYIDIYDRLSDDYGKWYEYGDKLMTVVKEESSTNLFTAFIGRGKGEEVSSAEDNESGQAGYGRRITFEDIEWSTEAGDPVDKPLGQNYVEMPEATALYGYEDGSPRYTVVEFSEIDDKELLLQTTYEHAVNESRPKAQFKSTVIEKGKAELGEVVTIIKDQENIRYKTRIFELTRDFKNKDIKSIEFGDKLVKTTAERSREASQTIKETEEQTYDWLEQLRQQIVNSYFNEDGYNYDLQAGNEYDLPGGYYSFDAPIDQNPSKAIYMGAGQLLIANSQTPDGHWEWRTAANGDGIVADVINSGVLRTITLESGQNPENNYWNLSTGDFRVGGETEYLTWNPSSGQLGMYWKDNDTSVEFANGSIVSTAKDDSKSVIQNGVILAYQPNKAGLGYIGYDQEGARPFYTMTLSWGANFRVRSHHGPDVGFKRDFEIYPGSYDGGGESIFFTDYFRHNGQQAIFESNVRINNDLNLPSGTVRAEEYSFRYGSWMYDDYRNSELRIVGGTGMRLYTEGSTSSGSNLAIRISSSHVLVHRTLSMEGHNITNQSDIRLKDNIRDTEISGIEETERLRFVDYEWKKDHPKTNNFPEGQQFGLIAQDTRFLSTQEQPDNHYLSIDLNKQLNLNTLTNQELIKRIKVLEKTVEEMVDDGATGESAIE